MEIIADLQLHSKYSRAVSPQMTIPFIAQWAAKKGIGLVATGDWTHPLWFREIQHDLEELGNGLLKIKNKEQKTKSPDVFFLLATEVSSIYSQGGKSRRVHTLIWVPSLAAAEKINEALRRRGCNLMADGRPIIGLSCIEVADLVLDIEPKALIIPAHCLHPESMILTEGFLPKQIQDIPQGESVLTHSGNFQKVTEIKKREYTGDSITIKPWYFRPGLTTTPEHPYWAIRTIKKCPSTGDICRPSKAHLNICRLKACLSYKPTWVLARDLEIGDMLVYPRPKRKTLSETINLSRSLKGFGLRDGVLDAGCARGRKVNDTLLVTSELSRLIGYYIAEGTTDGRNTFSFTFSDDETKYINDLVYLVKNVFGLGKPRIYRRFATRGVEIGFSSKIHAAWLANVCYLNPERRKASEKKLPSFLFNAAYNVQAEFLRGWYRGDKGYTSSRVLMSHIKTLCLQIGVIPSVTVDTVEAHTRRGNHQFGRRVIQARSDSFSFSTFAFFEDPFDLKKEIPRSQTKIDRRHGWIDQDNAYLPIKDIIRKPYSGEVYNLEVEHDHSYVSEFAAVHNCWTPWFSVFGGMSGFDSLEEAFGKFAKNVYAVETGLSCYDEKTEVLTYDGWKKISEVFYSDKVCTLNLKTDGIEFQNPTRLFKYQYKGKMYRLRTRRVDLLVTPNHKLLVRSCDFHNLTPFFLKETGLLFNKSKIFKKDGIWVGKEKKYFILPAVKIKHASRFYSGFRKAAEKKFPIKSWLKFFGFWIAEGWTNEDKKGLYNVCLANQNKVLLFEMRELLRSFEYNVYHRDNILRVRNYQLFQYLKQFGKSPDKFIPSDIKALSKELLAILLEYYLRGDGHVYGRNKKGLSATTSSIHLRDDLQEIALKVGISAYFKRGGKKGAVITSLPYKNKFYKNKQDIWRIYFIRQNRPVVIPSMVKRYNYTESWIDFNGHVFCLAVPNQVIYIRRNGIPLWCGNSNPSMNWRIKELDNRAILSFSDAHSGPKLGREATVFVKSSKFKVQSSKFPITYNDVYGAIVEQTLGKNEGNLEIGYTIEFYPEEGKYHYSGHRNCGVSFGPEETITNKGICPVCGRSLTQGVMQRVEELAGRTENDLQISDIRNQISDLNGDIRMIGSKSFPHRPGFAMLVPLLEIIAEAIGSPVSSPKVLLVYENLVGSLGGEFGVLLNASIDEIAKTSGERVAEGVRKVRRGEIEIKPGYDGVFGKVEIWNKQEGVKAVDEEQLTLFG